MPQLMNGLWFQRLLTVHPEDFNVKDSSISVLFWHNRTKIRKLCCYIMMQYQFSLGPFTIKINITLVTTVVVKWYQIVRYLKFTFFASTVSFSSFFFFLHLVFFVTKTNKINMLFT